MENDKILRLTKTTQTTIFCGTRESTFNALEYYLTTFGKILSYTKGRVCAGKNFFLTRNGIHMYIRKVAATSYQKTSRFILMCLSRHQIVLLQII